MRNLLFMIALVGLPLSVTYSNEDQPALISEAEAAKIVAAEEQARERAKDEREELLISAEIVSTVRLKQGDKTIIFNKVKPEAIDSVEEVESKAEADTATSIDKVSLEKAQKDYQSITLSGEVDETTGISELWWGDGEQSYRIFTNANFLHLGGIGTFEDATTRYSVFSIVTPTSSHKEEGKWSPSLSDFTAGGLEYLVIEGDENAKAYRGFEAMLSYYAENEESLRITYENNKKLREARRAYLEANPPKKRDIILNYSR